MSGDEIVIEGKEYVSSKRASELSSYAQDYIGQLARSAQIDARRMGGLWYVSMESIGTYEATAEKNALPSVTIVESPKMMDTIVSFDGKDYISANKASKLTGYNQDYIGQLARAGKILSRQVGRRWYVDRDGLIAHKDEKDALLAAVQSEAVGISTPSKDAEKQSGIPEEIMEYKHDNQGDLLPRVAEKTYFDQAKQADIDEINPEVPQQDAYRIPIRVARREVQRRSPSTNLRKNSAQSTSWLSRNALYGSLGLVVLTVVVVLAVNFRVFNEPSVYANVKSRLSDMTASVAVGATGGFLNSIETAIENLFVPELTYTRQG